jgi:hypothetical protein
MIATVEPPLMDLWRRQIAPRRRNREPRLLAAAGYLTNGPIVEDLIEIEKLILVVVHDEMDARCNATIRLAGYSGIRVPWGIRWGGPENSKFFKDLQLQPMAGARGLRLDIASADLFRLALHLDRDIERHLCYARRCKRPYVQLPRLWAGFRPADAAAVQGDGPELAEYCTRTGRCVADTLSAIRRDYFGLALFPFAWVSNSWQQAVTVLADLRRFPLRQVFPLTNAPEALIGFQGAAEYDFLNSRFRSGAKSRLGSPEKPSLAPA